jgi:hypothetical protein
MSKVLATLVALGLSSSAMAAASFDFGSIWFFPRLDANDAQENFAGQGQTVAANWDLDNDLILGAYMEATELNTGDGSSYPFQVNAINISKGVVKNASIGLHLGTFYDDYYGDTGMLTDLFGSITMISGGADKISGSLKATVGARYADENYQNDGNFNGYFVSVAIGIGI